eukprot:g13223.t1
MTWVPFQRRWKLLCISGFLLWWRPDMHSTPTVSAASSSPQKGSNDFMLSPRKFGATQETPRSETERSEVSYRVLNRPTSAAQSTPQTGPGFRRHLGRSDRSESSLSPQRYWQVEPLTGAKPPLLLREDLTTQHARQKVQTDELRTTLQDLHLDTERLQAEQRRQAAALKNSLKVGDASRLEKQVEGVASIEQRFDRLENDIGSVYESQRQQLQQALAENRQLARGLEEDNQRRESMMMELVDKVTRTGNMSQLSSELANATNAIHGQSADWSVLSRQIHQEVCNLTLEMKADRENRAVESSTRRMEVLKMMEDQRRQGALEALGISKDGLSETNALNGSQERRTRPGIMAVHHLVELNCKILRDMETQLIVRAGFVAGVFHFWRCEATLIKVGRYYQAWFQKNQDDWEAHLAGHRRSFEDELIAASEKVRRFVRPAWRVDGGVSMAAAHKEHVRQQHDLLLRQWAMGEAKGLFSQTYKSWAQYVKKEKTRRRAAANIHKVCAQWIMGKTKGLLQSCVWAWSKESKESALILRREKVRSSSRAKRRAKGAGAPRFGSTAMLTPRLERCLSEVDEAAKLAKDAAKAALQVAEKCKHVEEEVTKMIAQFSTND